MKGLHGVPVANPYTRIARQTRAELNTLLQQLGLGPMARLKLATPDVSRKIDAASWDDIDQ
jgi:phage terminase small subunit